MVGVGFSGVYAPASLKPARPWLSGCPGGGFFRGLCPGLIEAAQVAQTWKEDT